MLPGSRVQCTLQVTMFICALLGPAASPFYFSRVCIEHEWTDRKLPEIKAPENVANVASYSDFDNTEQ